VANGDPCSGGCPKIEDCHKIEASSQTKKQPCLPPDHTFKKLSILYQQVLFQTMGLALKIFYRGQTSVFTSALA
jgi:hypothetical protein